MVLEIVLYGHPALRSPGRSIDVIDDRIRQLASDMFETMEAAEGVGLAAQQVGLPVRLFVLDVRNVPKRPSRMWIAGKPVRVRDHMPLALINPKVELEGAPEKGVEGCLSLPGITADVVRPERVRVKATGLDGKPLEFEAEGLLARAVQHELDHLDGVLFIDRLDPAERKRIAPELAQITSVG
jgi:peptide deformylase